MRVIITRHLKKHLRRSMRGYNMTEQQKRRVLDAIIQTVIDKFNEDSIIAIKGNTGYSKEYDEFVDEYTIVCKHYGKD